MTIKPEIISSTAEAVDPDASEPAGADPRLSRDRIRRVRPALPRIIAALLVIVSAAGATWLYLSQYREEEQTGQQAATSAIAAATEGTVALLSYAPDTLASDLARAKTHLTGEFLTYYTKFSDEIVAPAAKQKAVNTHATVPRAAIADLRPDAAKVLLFLNQTTTSNDAPTPVQTASSVMVSLSNVDGRWLIAAFDPM